MIYEYAVNPSLCADWRDLKDLIIAFGREEGRLISDVPKKQWERSAAEAINRSNPKPVEKKRLKTFLKKLSAKALYVRNHTIDDKSEWIDNAIATHRIWPFRAIITDEYTGCEECVLENGLSLLTHDYWQAAPSVTVIRKAPNMVDIIRPIIENARQIVLVDRNFRLVDPSGHPAIRYKSVLLEFLNAIANKQHGPSINTVFYHVGDKYISSAELQRQCELYLKKEIPAMITLKFVIWPWDELHDRYLLTDIGGLDFGQGLDEWTGSGPETIKISRISNVDRQHWWSKCNQKRPNVELNRNK